MKHRLSIKIVAAFSLLCFAIAGIGQQPEQGNFIFPEDASGKALAEKLPPAQAKLPELPATKPQPRKVPGTVTNPAMPLTPAPVIVPQLPPGSAGQTPLPGEVPEELPLGDYAGVPPLPEIKRLAVSPAIKVPSVDVNRPPVVVQVKEPAPEPLNLDDPTEEASHRAALKENQSGRTEAAPFLPLHLPDPFVHRKVSELYESPPEETAPVTAAPHVPGK